MHASSGTTSSHHFCHEASSDAIHFETMTKLTQMRRTMMDAKNDYDEKIHWSNQKTSNKAIVTCPFFHHPNGLVPRAVILFQPKAMMLPFKRNFIFFYRTLS